MGSVDRNTEELNRKLKKRVAPHTGSVDRNESLPLELRREYVAPHTGSVDRNPVHGSWHQVLSMSLPTRGAWIEIDLQKRSDCEDG